MVKVVKKDGRVVNFNRENIINNLESSERVFGVTFKRDKEVIVDQIEQELAGLDYITSEKLFSKIEQELQDERPILSAFREYKQREQDYMTQYTDTDYQLKRLKQKDREVVNENGNKDSRTFVTQRDLTASVVAKSKGIQQFSERVQRAHLKGIIHLHDLDRFPYQTLPNCSLPNFEYLMSKGFDIGNTHVTPAQSLDTAISHLSILLSAITGDQYGGVTIHEVDTLLIPYAEKTHQKNIALYQEVLDGKGLVEEAAQRKTIKDIYKAMESLEYEINTITAHSAQTPFVSMSFGRTTDWVGREIQKAILQVRLNGMDNGEGGKITSIFPKLLFFVEDEVNLNQGDINYDIKQLAMETSRKRVYPDMISVENLKAIKEGCVISPMGCRSFLHAWKRPSTGEYEVVGRNNLGVTSVNLPRIAIKAQGNVKLFWSLLDEALQLVVDSLHTREDIVLSADLEESPILYKQGGLYGGKEVTSVRDIYTGDNRKRSTLSVGYVGIHNAMVALFKDEHWHEEPTLKQFSVQMLQHMQDYIDDIQEDFEAYVSLYSTPSESLADRFATLDKQRFGEIKGVNDDEYYENSFHYPSKFEINPFDKIEFEEDYYKIATAGFMHYVEAPNLSDNPEAFESIWDEAHDRLVYFGINISNDECFECGFEGEFKVDKEGYHCPKCGNSDGERMNVVRRLCGYLGQPSIRPVVKGKAKEIASRVKHVHVTGNKQVMINYKE